MPLLPDSHQGSWLRGHRTAPCASTLNAGVRYSEFTYDDETGRGNLTQEFDYDSTKTGGSQTPPLTATPGSANAIRPFGASASDYDANGNLLRRLDANNTPTTYEYGAGSCMNSYPTAVNVSYGVTGETLTTSMTWDCRSGQMLTSTDPNNLPNDSHLRSDGQSPHGDGGKRQQHPVDRRLPMTTSTGP